eukprot:CAMPEP_0119335784 /NCGR_PEP_ID=MMETSP1333-20130426/90386_1 /TAXON_ID=418940 /ORGANISM="Scyphosphaera apsteinii, Strain RCC1455" /LENGTH=37 /DNA_ID= /DNA_START= /DNA_END= /DNA_ORIENTATION=
MGGITSIETEGGDKAGGGVQESVVGGVHCRREGVDEG